MAFVSVDHTLVVDTVQALYSSFEGRIDHLTSTS